MNDRYITLTISIHDLDRAITALYDSADWHKANSWITSGDDLREAADRLRVHWKRDAEASPSTSDIPLPNAPNRSTDHQSQG